MNPATAYATPFLYQDFAAAAEAIRDGLAQGHAYMTVLGESGCGKTTLLRYLLANLDKNAFSVLYRCPSHSHTPPLGSILAQALQLPPWCSRAQRSHLLTMALKNHCARLLLWLDEAQMLPRCFLHELRLLAEAELDQPPLFGVILCALPCLDEQLRSPELFSLHRRIATRVRLRGLQLEEARPFICHALSNDAAQRFSPEALQLLFEHARGLPALLKASTQHCLRTCPSTQPITRQMATELLDVL